ncbi:SUMO-activating enzyme subunit 1-like [Ornithodoros turicata]|uniref:SUMO-activating enzyme subunit 1-like n=1 Tax=Ornithodoros turicata TaxID=34597 RepID=UPI003139F6A7
MLEEKLVPELSEEEADLYDRQIRLWGLESQKRLRAVRVLVAGMNGLGAEVSKNLILAGIKSITLLDDKEVSEDDFYSQFMIKRDDIGKNRAHCSKAYAQDLNPMVKVIAEEGAVAEKDEDYFRNFDVVCCTETSTIENLVRINTICRDIGAKFFCGHVWGFHGYFFTDLIEHTYTQEVRLPPPPKKTETLGPSAAKKPKMTEEISPIVKKTMTFVPLSRALQVKAGKSGTGLDKKTSSMFLWLHVLLRFHEKTKAPPAPSDRESLLEMRDEVANDLDVDKARISDDLFDNIFGELGATCAVLGGILGQEIIKVASCKDLPMKNFFLFNGEECCGLQETVGR